MQEVSHRAVVSIVLALPVLVGAWLSLEYDQRRAPVSATPPSGGTEGAAAPRRVPSPTSGSVSGASPAGGD